MPPRKRKRPVSTYNANVFVSEAASVRYNEYNRKRLAIPERGIDVPGPINDEIEKRDWEFLCGDPAPAIAPLVMEFYANAKENEGLNDTVFVRGKQINFSAETINAFYEITAPDDSHSFHDFLENHVDWSDVIASVCREETAWKFCKGTKEVSSFPTKQLSAFARAWFYFLSARLMPATHLSSVHRNRAALLFALINDIPVNVGRVINESISACIRDESTAFVCPSLITSLCKDAGVHWDENEPLLPERGPFDAKAFHSMKDSTSGFGTAETYEMPPPPPRRQTIQEQQGELEKLVRYHIADFGEFKIQVSEIFEYQRKSIEVIHQSLLQLAQKEVDMPVVLQPLPPYPVPPAVAPPSDSD